MIFSDYLSGIRVRKIATKLNDMGIRTTKGNKFDDRHIEYILTNPVYIGKLRRSKNGRNDLDRFHEDPENTIYVDGKHEPIIDNEIFEKTQKKRHAFKKLYKKYDRKELLNSCLKD